MIIKTTQEEILEYNKRCAEFLGWKQIKDLENIVEENEHLKDCWYLPYTELVFWNTDVLKFSTDWNWIMDVVTAIREKGWRFDIQHHSSVTSSEIGVTIWRKFPGGGDEEVVELYHEDDKTVHIQSINQFLIWYNENKFV